MSIFHVFEIVQMVPNREKLSHMTGMTNLESMIVITIKPFLTNVPLTGKPGSWFLLAKCLKNTCGRVTF